VLTGDYLTTEGQSAGDDIEIIERAGLEPNVDGNEFDPSAVKARAAADDDDDDDVAVETAAGTATREVDATD